MALDVTDAHAARVEGQDLVVEALEPTPVLRNHLRLERPVAVARYADIDGTRLGLDRLGRVTVTAVAAVATLGLVGLVAEMLGQLGLEHPLHERSLDLLEHSARAEKRLRILGELHELVEELGFDHCGHG